MKNDKVTKVDGDAHKVKVTSPKGEARWASLKSPKSWNNEDAGKYQISTVHSAEEAQGIIDMCQGTIEKVCDFMGKRPKLSQYDPYKVLEDGRVEIRWKKKFFAANDKYPATPPIPTILPDGSRVDLDSTEWSVGNGSIVQVGGYIVPYYTPMLGLGVSLRLMAVNVIQLEKYTGSNSEDDFDFVAGKVGAESAEVIDF